MHAAGRRSSRKAPPHNRLSRCHRASPGGSRRASRVRRLRSGWRRPTAGRGRAGQRRVNLGRSTPRAASSADSARGPRASPGAARTTEQTRGRRGTKLLQALQASRMAMPSKPRRSAQQQLDPRVGSPPEQPQAGIERSAGGRGFRTPPRHRNQLWSPSWRVGPPARFRRSLGANLGLDLARNGSGSPAGSCVRSRDPARDAGRRTTSTCRSSRECRSSIAASMSEPSREMPSLTDARTPRRGTVARPCLDDLTFTRAPTRVEAGLDDLDLRMSSRNGR